MVGKTLDGIVIKSVTTKVSETALDSYINDVRSAQKRKPLQSVALAEDIPVEKETNEQENPVIKKKYLFLNFAEYGENSPRQQYKALASRYSQLKHVSYEKFIQACFPVLDDKKYYFSMPNFLRNNTHLNNIVIRSTRDNFSECVLPKGLEIILRGHVELGTYGRFMVEGIELIDCSVFKYDETEICTIAKCAFREFYGFDITPEPDNSVLTYDFMEDMCTKYIVPELAVPLKIYNDWKEYIAFRQYYLEEQGKGTFPFNSCKAIKCYIISQHDYNKNPEKYDEHLLDNKKDEQIIVTKEFDNSEQFELVRVTIEGNKKELFANTVKNEGKIPAFEQCLRRFIRSEITLQDEYEKQQIHMDERIRFFYRDIPPDYSELESEVSEKLKAAYKEIDERFKAMSKHNKTEQELQKREEKAKAKEENSEALEAAKKELEDNETIRCYYIYFKLQPDDTVEYINKKIEENEPICLKLNQVAEKIKIDRQRKSLDSIFSGEVKNPFLATYLFAPDKLSNVNADIPEPEYFSQRLNDKQKEAVKKALASESLFLLQGPPGTGKTEVIAEIAAQLAKSGKRILISSETHKAIDNVFERLPKIPEIRPLRLIPLESKKDPSSHSTERLVDNFYINISDRIDKEVAKFENFNGYKDKFEDEYKKLRNEYSKLKGEKSRIENIQIELDKIKRERESLEQRYDVENEKLRLISDERETLSSQVKNEKKIIENFSNLLLPYSMLNQDFSTLVFIHESNISEIKKEIELLSDNSELTRLEAECARVKAEMDKLRNPDTDEIIDGKEEERKSFQASYIDLKKKIKAHSFDSSKLSITKIINKAKLEHSMFASLANNLMDIKLQLADCIAKSKNDIGTELDEKVKEYNTQKGILDGYNSQIHDKDKELQTKKENNGYEDYKAAESELKRKITGFFKQFDIMRTYEDITAALDIIKDEWSKLERNFATKESENKEKIPMYKRMSKFLKELHTDDSIEEDRKAYTKNLFEKVNIFGLTCTSRDKFLAKKMKEFQKYALDDLDVKKQGIDVVIIDEVSKSSLLELLIPILYGKTVILVGDHRQLPPMYDLRNMHKDDFEDLDPEIINLDKNKKFTNLYEECFFKTLFESVPDRLRVTLTKQYRCHEHIMRVFNHFYGDNIGRGSLEIGVPHQNDQKQHGLHIKSKSGKSIIAPEKHIYFIDCGDSYEKFGDSTSATNEKEAQVIAALARKIDEKYGQNGITNMSMGVICTYKDQVKLIRKKIPKNTLKNICDKKEERFIISTVDDFQGDERDIIFVSMVRNPEYKKRGAVQAEFVKKFERINVALSRARCLLVIVGAKDFLSGATIDLPDMGGNKVLDKKAHPIYREIIKTISIHGIVHKAADIIGEKK